MRSEGMEEDSAELLPGHAVDDEVHGAVEYCEVARHQVELDLPLGGEVLAGQGVEAVHHHPVSAPRSTNWQNLS